MTAFTKLVQMKAVPSAGSHSQVVSQLVVPMKQLRSGQSRRAHFGYKSALNQAKHSNTVYLVTARVK